MKHWSDTHPIREVTYPTYSEVLSDLGLTEVQAKRIIAGYKDIKEQAEFYGLEIDFDTLELRKHEPDTTPSWLKRWNDKRRESDNDPSDPEQAMA